MSLISRAVCAIGLIGALLPVGVAEAGTYVVRSCNVPGQGATSASAWQWLELAPGMYANDECSGGGGFGINAGPMPRATVGVLALHTPTPSIAIRQVRLWMIARLSGGGSGLFITLFANGDSGEFRHDIFGPPGGDTLGTPYVTPALPPDTRLFRLWLACTGGTPQGCAPASPNPVEIRGAETTLYEDVPPSGAIAGGTLLSGGAQSGERTLDYRVADEDSGVAQITVTLGGTVVGTLHGTDCAYDSYAACPRNRTGALAIDTRKVPNGTHPLLMRITDAAGNREAIQAPAAVTIDNGTASEFAPNGTGASADARLTAGFVGRRGTSVVVNRHKAVKVQGRLTTAAGAPIAAARIDVAETIKGAKSSTARNVMTAADGRFTFTSSRRPSRVVRFAYRPALGRGTVTATRRLRIYVPAAASFRVRLRGTLVTYSGRLLTRPVPPRGKAIRVEGRAAGGAWTRFAMKRTNKSGRFSGRYRLRVRRPGVRLQFRLRIPTQAGYPYAAGTGHALTRTVR